MPEWRSLASPASRWRSSGVWLGCCQKYRISDLGDEMNPAKEGLPALATYTGPQGEERLLFLGLEAATKGICKGWKIGAEDYRFYRKLIMRVRGLEEALDHREELQGGNDD